MKLRGHIVKDILERTFLPVFVSDGLSQMTSEVNIVTRLNTAGVFGHPTRTDAGLSKHEAFLVRNIAQKVSVTLVRRRLRF